MSLAISRVRASDPLTSFNAAVRADEFSGSHADRILAVLRKGGGMTPEYISAACGLTVVQIDRRLCEIQRAGKAAVMQKDGEDVVYRGMRVWTAV